jgi:hypothetical protein
MADFLLLATGVCAGVVLGLAIAFFILRDAKPRLPW